MTKSLSTDKNTPEHFAGELKKGVYHSLCESELPGDGTHRKYKEHGLKEGVLLSS